jgi:UPF0176 protein
MGVPEINPSKDAGTYIDSFNWNKLIKDKNTIVVDTRNHYEVSIGSFKKSINPNTKNFSEFPEWVGDNLGKYLGDDDSKNIAMFCTGGIRCEKASALFNEKGFNDVYQLEGGILNYFKKSKDKKNFDGECFVFDDRVTVDKNLNPGDFIQCFACRRPISKIDKNRPEYTEGISCHNCIDEKSDDDRKRFADRQNQNLLNNKK